MGFGDHFEAGTTCADLGYREAIPYGFDDTREGRVTASILQARGLGLADEPLLIPTTATLETSAFLTIPDARVLGGDMLENSFAALPVGTRILAVTDKGTVDLVVETEPTLREGKARLVPTCGVVVRNYTVFWQGQVETLDGLWVFLDGSGAVGRLESVYWPTPAR